MTTEQISAQPSPKARTGPQDGSNGPWVIGLVGTARVGKDTVGELLTGYERRAFADPLKAMALAVDPDVVLLPEVGHARLTQIVEQMGWEDAKTIPGVRRLLQRLGTEGARATFGWDCWIDALRETMKPGVRYVITDVRFPNEVDAIRSGGGMIWRVQRPGFEPTEHASEAGVVDIKADLTIHNYGDLDDLGHAVKSALLTCQGWQP